MNSQAQVREKAHFEHARTMMEVLKLMAEIGALLSSLTTLGMVGIIFYQHRLMWRDFARRKKINGGGD